MQTVFIVRNKADKRLQTGWYSETQAKQQAEETEKEMRAEEFPEEECEYEVVGPVHIQDSVTHANFDDSYYNGTVGPIVDKMEDAVNAFIHETGWEFEDAIQYLVNIVKDRNS